MARVYDDKTFAQIARETGLPLGTVLTRMRLALDKLRLALRPGRRHVEMTPETTRFPRHNPDDLAWLAFGYADGTSTPSRRRRSSAGWRRPVGARGAGQGRAAGRFGRRRGEGRAARAAAAGSSRASRWRRWSFRGPRLLAPLRPAVPNPEAVALAWSASASEGEPISEAAADESIDGPDEPSFEPGDAPPGWLLEAAALSNADDGRGS